MIWRNKQPATGKEEGGNDDDMKEIMIMQELRKKLETSEVLKEVNYERSQEYGWVKNDENIVSSEGKKNRKLSDKSDQGRRNTKKHVDSLGSNVDPNFAASHCEETDMND